MTEAAITASILRRLRARGGWWRKKHGGPFGHVGDPDIHGCYLGRYVAIEVKQPGKKPTKAQQRALDAIRGAGGIAFVATSWDDVAREMSDALSWRI